MIRKLKLAASAMIDLPSPLCFVGTKPLESAFRHGSVCAVLEFFIASGDDGWLPTGMPRR